MEDRKYGKNLIFIWVPSHTGITGNEKADQAAQLARTGEEAVIQKIKYINIEDWTQHMKKKMYENWEQKWRAEQSKLVEIKTDCRKWGTSTRSSRKEETILCRIRIGHCLFTHGYHFKGLEAPTCEKCNNTPQTVKHLIQDCPQFRKIRYKLKINGTIQEILEDKEEKIISLFQYLKKTGYYNRI